MKRFWFHFAIWIGIAASLCGLALGFMGAAPARAQAIGTDTPLASGGAFITQTYSEPINVRTGPSTVYYPVIGHLPIGATAAAIAASPSREWIEIEYSAGPGGVGWIYAANVTLTGTLQVVEPPPTPAPLETATIDPTLAAQFNLEPTQTRLPTFTPPPPLTVAVYSDPASTGGGLPLGIMISVIAALGAAVLGISFFGRR